MHFICDHVVYNSVFSVKLGTRNIQRYLGHMCVCDWLREKGHFYAIIQNYIIGIVGLSQH